MEIEVTLINVNTNQGSIINSNVFVRFTALYVFIFSFSCSVLNPSSDISPV